MGTARQPDAVKLIVSLISGDVTLMGGAQEELVRVFGPIDYASDVLPFDHTDYYAPEFGQELRRRFVSHEQLVSPSELPAIKLQTNALELSLPSTELRSVNIDPGYISLGKLVLATTKNHAHRIYLGEGIYAECTLSYQQGRFRPWPWTYPDYASEGYCAIFDRIRLRYKGQLRELRH